MSLTATLPPPQRLNALDYLLRQGHYAQIEAEARALAEQYPESGGVLGILALARQAAANGGSSVNSSTPQATLPATTAAFSAERFAILQAGGLDAVPALWVTGLLAGGDGVTADDDAPFSRYAEALLNERGGLERYISELTPEQCRADAQGYLDATGSACPAWQPLDLDYLGLVGLWFPHAPVVFCQRDVLDAGLAAYLDGFNASAGENAARENADGHDPAAALYALGEQLAEREQAMQHWARVLPNPLYQVEVEELAHSPHTVAQRLFNALPPASRPVATTEQQPAPAIPRFVGVAEAFKHHLGPLEEGYRAAMQAEGLPADSIERFDWQLKGRLVAVDNAARLPREDTFTELMATNAFAVVAFDPASRVSADSLAGVDEFQHVPHALLGDGNPAMLYATLDETLTAPLEPLPAEQLPESLQRGAQVLTRLPINTLRLDDIDGLASLDWLILDGLSDAEAVLENGERALEETLLLQVGIAFAPTHHRQPNLAEISHWASRHGFAFYRLNNPRHRSLLPERDDIARPQATQLASADALFIPTPQRLAALDDNQRKRLAFVLDTVFGIHDLPYQLLAECQNTGGAELAERYLKARGYVGVHRAVDVPDLPSFFAVRKPHRSAERGLAAALARHNIHRAVGLAQQLLKECPGDAEGRYYLGQALSHLGQHDQALAQLVPLYDEEPGLRYGLVLGEAQHRAGQNKAVRRTAEKLADQYPAHPAVARLALLPVLASHKRRELDDALERCRELLKHADSALVAAGLGDAVSARADLLHLAARFEQSLAQDAEGKTRAVAAHEQALEALEALAGRQGPLRAQVLAALAAARREAESPEAAVEALWQACATYPYSLHTVAAYASLREALGQSPNNEHQRLAALHSKVQEIWRGYQGEQLQFSFGDFGLPYQGFEPLMLPGTRSARVRLAHYGLEELLPEGATALDIGCNHGFLLLGLAEKLGRGEGFDISKACVEVGNAVAAHLGHTHIQLHHKAFDDFVGKQTYDLVIACAVHQWIGRPLEDFGDELAALCKPGGVVLLESQGARDLHRTEPGFADNATAIASAGFSVLRKGSLCDDSLNYREFWLLKRCETPASAKPPAKKAAGKQAIQPALPHMEGDATVLEPMRDICRTLARHGAWFNPDLRLQADNGNLALYGTPGAARASYMRVPVALMPQLECFDIVAQGGKLAATPNGTPLLPHQEGMMEAMLGLYNATDKLNLWRQSLPFLAWQDTPRVLEYLLAARPLNANLTRCHDQFKAGEHDKLLVDSFLNSRKFGVTEHHLKALGVTGSDTHRNALMPLVDCLNHRLSAEGYNTPLVGGKPAMRTFHEPDAETGELFVRYNLYDAVDTTLSYGFMDAACTWLSSVPVTLSVSGQTLKVQGLPMMLRGPLPATFEDIREYMPALHRQGERQASVTKLMLCTQNPYSLRRVLTYLVYELGIAHTDFVARQQVAALECQLIEQNRQWWQGLSELTAALSEDHPARQLAGHSLGLIEQVAWALEH